MNTKNLVSLMSKKHHMKDGYLASSIIIINIIFYLGTMCLIFLSSNTLIKIIASLLNGLSISLCFVVAHDLCHGAFFKNKLLNELWGRVLFLPSLTSFSLWRIAHNVKHHNFTCYANIDFAWAPDSPEQYFKRNIFSQLLYISERSILGHGIYWLYEIWWKSLVMPKKLKDYSYVNSFDFILIIFYLILIISVDFSAVNILLSLIIPLFIFSYLVGFVTYLHHTGSNVKWYNDYNKWNFYLGSINSTRHIQFPAFIDFIFHRIMHHNAHHVNASIPMYHLVDAQKELVKNLGPNSGIQQVTFTIREYLRDCYQCKLYDYENHKWYTFKEAHALFGKEQNKQKTPTPVFNVSKA